MTDAYIGLGANLGDRAAAIRSAVERLAATGGVEVTGVSQLRETAPVGYADQPSFLNGAVRVTTTLSAPALLVELLRVERELGRVRGAERYGPRTIDLDLLLYGDEEIDGPGLTVPHPRLHERRFALEPLLELEPTLVVPGRGPVTALLAALD